MTESSKDYKERVQKRRVYSIGQTPPISNTMSDGQSMSDPYDQVSDNPNPMRMELRILSIITLLLFNFSSNPFEIHLST